MIKRIDLFLPPPKQSEMLHNLTAQIAAGFTETGIETRILEAEYHNPRPFLEKLFASPPDCTLSLNGLLPDENGNFFCDMIRIPHISYLLDTPNDFFPLAKSAYTIVASVDRFFCDFFRGLNSQKVIFLPLGVDSRLKKEPTIEPVYPLTFIGTPCDYESIRQEWKKNYPADLCKALDNAVEIAFAEPQTSYIQAFVKALALAQSSTSLDPRQINYPMIFNYLETYVRGKDQIDLLKTIKDVPVNIFPFGASNAPWKKYLKDNQAQYVIHEPVNYQQSIDVMKKSKIVLNSNPQFKDGSHPFVFEAMAVEAIVITSSSTFLKESFKEDESILFYNFNNRQAVNEIIHTYLNDTEKSKKLARQAKEIISNNHTWNHRALQISKELSSVLSTIV